jgi:hypothetical protein
MKCRSFVQKKPARRAQANGESLLAPRPRRPPARVFASSSADAAGPVMGSVSTSGVNPWLMGFVQAIFRNEAIFSFAQKQARLAFVEWLGAW